MKELKMIDNLKLWEAKDLLDFLLKEITDDCVALINEDDYGFFLKTKNTIIIERLHRELGLSFKQYEWDEYLDVLKAEIAEIEDKKE